MNFDPGRVSELADPLPALLELQDQDPIHWAPRYRSWLVTRYADVKTAFTDSRLSPRRVLRDPAEMDPAFALAYADYKKYLDLWVTFRDPPDHTRLRGLVNKGMTPSAISGLRPVIEEIVARLLNEMPQNGQIDLVQSFGFPLPAEVIGELLGVPRSMLDDLQRWSVGIASSTSGTGGDQYRRACADFLEMKDYLSGVVAERRRNPGTAIIDRMIAAHEGGDRLSHDELVSNLILFLFAGHETTTSVICCGMRTLLRNPEQLADLRANLDDQELVRNAVEEMLRYDGALFISMRVALENFEWHGRNIKEGDRVFLYHLAANHDPREFEAPSKFNIRRADASHNIAFGHGIHFCLGAPLARLEMFIALPALLKRYAKLELVDDPVVWADNFVLRAPKRLLLHAG